jgi:hypothetical protein
VRVRALKELRDEKRLRNRRVHKRKSRGEGGRTGEIGRE